MSTPIEQLRLAEREARALAGGCPIYAPKQGVDEGEALYHATRSGATSAACGERWMALRSRLNKQESV